jgi:hypothetical protein
MLWFMIGHVFTTLLTWVSIGRRSNQEKDLAIILERHDIRPGANQFRGKGK